MLGEADVNILSRSFSAIDADLSGQIDVAEFCTYFGLSGHRQYWLSRKAFRMFDTDGSGDIDQLEYICGIMEYCSMDFDTLSNFAFELFDMNGDGVLVVTEFRRKLADWGMDGANPHLYLGGGKRADGILDDHVIKVAEFVQW